MRRRQFLAGLAASATTLAAPALALSPEHKRLLGAGANGPSLDLNFLNTGSLDGRITFTRASNATYFDTTGTLQTATTNVPRFDNDPVTLASLGLLIEEQRTNSIRNPRAEGAVVGTPGTLPTNWAVTAAAGLTTNVIATGTENGVPYVDLQVTGTSNATVWTLVFEAPTVVAAAQNQVWSSSGYVRVSNGSLTNVTNMSVGFAELNGGGTLLVNDTGSTFTPTVSGLVGQRYSSSITVAQATAAFIRPSLFVNVSNAAAINFTIRIGAPQLELGGFATSVILPPAGTPAAATRAAEHPFMPVGSWLNRAASTLVLEVVVFGTLGGSHIAGLDDGTPSNRLAMRDEGTNGASTAITSGGVTAPPIGSNIVTSGAGAVLKYAIATTGTVASSSGNGAAAVNFTSVVQPIGLTQLTIGWGNSGAPGSWVRRLQYFPRAMPGAELQQRTT